jgi:hypothetical protein
MRQRLQQRAAMAESPGELVRPSRAGVGRRAKALIAFALAASFALLTYGSYAQSAQVRAAQVGAQMTAHVGG